MFGTKEVVKPLFMMQLQVQVVFEGLTKTKRRESDALSIG